MCGPRRPSRQYDVNTVNATHLLCAIYQYGPSTKLFNRLLCFNIRHKVAVHVWVSGYVVGMVSPAETVAHRWVHVVTSYHLINACASLAGTITCTRISIDRH